MSAMTLVTRSLFKGILKVIDKTIQDKDLAVKVKAELEKNQNDLFKTELDAVSRIIVSESSGGVLQRNGRPLLMLTIIAILFNNYILIPYGRAFGLMIPVLDIPDGLWSLLTLGVSGYVVGRSGEKISLNLRRNNDRF